MSTMDQETKRIKRKRRRVTYWTFAVTFMLSLCVGTGPLGSLLGAIFFSVIARMCISSELDDHYKILYPGGR
jgi:hypothetical protein